MRFARNYTFTPNNYTKIKSPLWESELPRSKLGFSTTTLHMFFNWNFENRIGCNNINRPFVRRPRGACLQKKYIDPVIGLHVVYSWTVHVIKNFRIRLDMLEIQLHLDWNELLDGRYDHKCAARDSDPGGDSTSSASMTNLTHGDQCASPCLFW